MISYNHAEFIGKAFESVLMQETDFDYEIVIGDDFSTDGTDAIIRSLQARWPDRIRPLQRTENLGMGRNLSETLAACTGQYIAILEGDDYWTDRRKLQLQVNFLDAQVECVLCHHAVEHILWPEEKILRAFPPGRYRRQRPTQRELAMFNFIQTCSVLFRRNCLPGLDDEYQKLNLGDWPLFVLLAQRGWIGYLDCTMAHYRVHSKNTWNLRRADDKIRAMDKMARYLLERVDSSCKEFWKDTIIALAFKDLLLAFRSFVLATFIQKLLRFVQQSAEFRKPMWIVTRLWAYCKAYRS
jgi:glycosyltransferase involved in cell wall biosynthesis